MTAGLVSVAAFVCIAGEALLPHIMPDSARFSSEWPYLVGAPIAVASISALIVLWIRRRSMLDLWLMVVMFLYLVEVPLSYYPAPSRFSPGWYSVRIFGFLSSSLVLIVLLYEIETLYARLLGAVLAQRREREARLMTGDAVAASIAHEVKQPLTAMVTSADAGFRFLDRSPPNLDRAKEAFKLISADGHRAGEVVENIRANFRSDVRTRTSLDLNELIREALAMERADLERHRILVQAETNKPLPEVRGNRVQLQQVLLNLITNAIYAMAAKDEPRVLSVKSECTKVKVYWCRWRTPAQESVREISIGYSTRSSRPNPTVWGWVCRFAARSSRPTMAGCGLPRTAPMAPCSSSPCTQIIRCPPGLDSGSEVGTMLGSLRAPRVGHRYLEHPGHSYQLGKRSRFHLLHDVPAMYLERDLADAQLGRGLFVEKAAHDQRKDLAFPWRQGRKALTQLGQLGSLPPRIAILRDGSIDCPHQVCFLERFGQEVHRARLDRAHGRGNIAMARDENNLRVIPVRGLALEVQSVDVRKFHIQNQA